jgi:hypothetical protein
MRKNLRIQVKQLVSRDINGTIISIINSVIRILNRLKPIFNPYIKNGLTDKIIKFTIIKRRP